MQKKYFKKEKGFTIIETMIAIALFLIIVVIGMGALLNANLIHAKSQNMRSIMDNMSFIIEDMSRNIRTGSNYHCIDSTNVGTASVSPHSCTNGGGISFESAFGEQWEYTINYDGSIQKSTDGGITFVALTPPEVKINPISGFSVFGAEPFPDKEQPLVKIRLVGTITYQNVITPFSLQTSVSQRASDSTSTPTTSTTTSTTSTDGTTDSTGATSSIK